MSSIKLSTPSSGSISLSPANTASNLTITVPAVNATMATLTTPSFVSTIGVGGATPAASGAGITFPATQSASTDANTLDDYEEGSWTGAISDGTNGIAINGTYTKIGRTVTITYASYAASITSLTATSGQLRITGLPFSSLGEHFYAAGGVWPSLSGMNYFNSINGSTVFYWQANSVNDVNAISRGTFSNPPNMSFYGSYTYQTS